MGRSCDVVYIGFPFFYFDIIDNFRYVGTYIYIALIILYLLLACGTAYFYLMRTQPQIAARVWGILGALILILQPLILIGRAAIIFLIATGGALLAIKKPRLAGILMLVSALLSGHLSFFMMAIAAMNFIGPPPEFILFPLGAISFLIPAGILALSRQRKEPVSRKMALGLIGVSLIVPLLGYFIMT